MNRLPMLPILAVSLALLGVAAGLYKNHFPPGPVADEAAYVMMAQSLWHDHDLRYEKQDLERAYRIWDQGPYGLILFTRDGGETMFYGKPYVYSLAAMPFYAVFGDQGLMIFNMALFLGMVWCGWWFLRSESSGPVGLWVGGFFFGSTAFAYVFWMQPEVFNMALVFFALLAWRWLRRSAGEDVARRWEVRLLLGAGALIGAAFVSKEILILLGGPIGLDLLLRRRWRGVAAFVAGIVLAGGCLVGLQWKHTDTWSPYRDVQRRSFDKSFPLESGEDHWALYRGTSFGSWSGIRPSTTPRVLAHDIYYFVAGRHVGLLPYFPFALYTLGLFLIGPKERSRIWLLLAILAYCGVVLALRPDNFHGGSGFLGNRYFASIYPALLFLPERRKVGKGILLPFAAAGLWTLPVVMTPVQQVAPEFGLQVHTRTAAFQRLPLELTLLPQGRIPNYWINSWGQGVWIMPRENFFYQEKREDGTWMRGASRSEIHIVSPIVLEQISFVAQSLSASNVLRVVGDDEVAVRFDSEGKRSGTPISVRPELVAKDLWIVFSSEQNAHEYIYRIELTLSDGLMPARNIPDSTDERLLGAFLKFN